MASEFTYIEFARWLVLLALGLHVLVIGLCAGGQAVRDRRLIQAARNAMMVAGGVIAGAAGCLVAGFLQGNYQVKYIFDYSERDLPIQFKLAGLWAGLDGSLLFWSMLVGFAVSIVAYQFRRDSEHPVGRRMEPHVYIVFSLVQIFFLSVVAFAANPFLGLGEAPGWTLERFQQMFPAGVEPDGGGLNPLLQNYWMAIHPPTLYFGWVVYTVPFAYGMAALMSGEQGSYWIRKVRRWMMIGWLFNTSGIIMGGLWAYEVLGWGGYWAWDPVENASFLPWFASTAFLHSIMVQERRDMLKVWNSFLVILTFFYSIVGTYLTRSGIVSSVHAFANGEVGRFFEIFLWALFLSSAFLLAYRSPMLRSRSRIDPNRLESLLSREAVFVLNNLILLAISVAILVLTLWPFLTRVYDGQPITVGPPVYNFVTNPLWCVLLLLTAIGPGLGWIRTTKKNLARNFGWAALAALPLGLAMQLGAIAVRGSAADLDPIDPLTHIYPAGVVNYLAAFIITCLGFEVVRAARNRGQRTGKGFLSAFGFLLLRNNRRYGGYLVHVGMALLAFAVVNSSIYRVEVERELRVGESTELGEYTVTMSRVLDDPDHPVYELKEIELTVSHGGVPVAVLTPEVRFHRNKSHLNKPPQRTTEVAVYKPLLQDVYAYFEEARGGVHRFTFFRNPYMNLLWAGWFVMVAGGVWAALPMGRRRVGLAD